MMFGIIFILVGLFVLIGWAYAIKELLKSNKKTVSGNHGFDELFICSNNDLQKSLLKKR